MFVVDILSEHQLVFVVDILSEYVCCLIVLALFGFMIFTQIQRLVILCKFSLTKKTIGLRLELRDLKTLKSSTGLVHLAPPIHFSCLDTD